MKKSFYLLFTLFLFFISFDSVMATTNYYDENTDILIASPYDFEVISGDEMFEGYNYDYDVSDVYINNAVGIYTMAIGRYPLDYKNFELETSFSKDDMNGGLENNGYAITEGYINEYSLYYYYMIATYDDKYYYTYIIFVEEMNDNYKKQFINMVINSNYQYSKNIQSSTEQDDTILDSTEQDDTILDSTEQDDTILDSNEQDDTILDSNEQDDTILDSNQPSENFYDKIVILANDVKFKNFLLKVCGSLFFVIVGIVMLVRKKMKISIVNLFGMFLVLSTLARALIDDDLLFTADKLEVIYLILFFIPSVVGLGLISREKYIDRSADVINKIIDNSKGTLSQTSVNEIKQPTQNINQSQATVENSIQLSNQAQQAVTENIVSNTPQQENQSPKQQIENVIPTQNTTSNVEDNITLKNESTQKLISVEELMNQEIISNDKDKI